MYFRGIARRSAPPIIFPIVTKNMLLSMRESDIPSTKRYAMVNVLMFAMQCSNPDMTNDMITRNITISFPLSDFIRVPVHTARHTRKLHMIPLNSNSDDGMESLAYIKLSKYSVRIWLEAPLATAMDDNINAPAKFPI